MERQSVDVLLVGGGVAAARCARALRRHGFEGTIQLVGDEQIHPYNRPPLSKELLRDDLPRELALAEPPSWYERRNVSLVLGTPAVSLDPERRMVELADGQGIHYRQLLLAMGAEPRRPAIPGAEHARLLRTLPDAEAIRSAAVPGARAVVIGGGFIGVEVASSLAARSLSVSVVEVAYALWGGTMGQPLSDWALERLAAAGVDVRLGARCESVTADGVRLADASLAADLVVAGVGVVPRVGLAADAGLEVDNGVLVDDEQRTSARDIFAAGDMARPRNGARVEHWHSAREAGERAALAMIGQPVPPRRPPWVFSEVGGTSLDVVGLAPTWDDIVELDGGFAFVDGGRVTQIAILGGAFPVEDARSFVERGVTPDQLSELVPAG
jgi:3-phenylpropionate/trans-cinnamate dioxygenase ferredoxin reductase subunit